MTIIPHSKSPGYRFLIPLTPNLQGNPLDNSRSGYLLGGFVGCREESVFYCENL